MNATLTYPYFYPPAEKAFATLQGRPIPGSYPPAPLQLSPFPFDQPPPPGSIPQPGAATRVVKQLPSGYTDAQLYDLFRPFGALHAVRTGTQFGADSGTVDFWREDEAKRAEEEMHCAEVEDRNIAVQVYNQRRGPGAAPGGPVGGEISPTAPPFVPSAHTQMQMYAGSGAHSPPFHGSPRRGPAPFVHGPGQQVQFAPPSGPGSGSHSGLIDPCNLFIKASLILIGSRICSHCATEYRREDRLKVAPPEFQSVWTDRQRPHHAR